MPQQFIDQSRSSLNNNINTAVILAAGRGERIAGDEEFAKANKLGMWAMTFQYPWDFRKAS